MAETVRLTELTDCGGCGAKLGADLLSDLMPAFASQPAPSELLIGLATPDDAAVYQVAPKQAILASADFFPPIVDDPYTFGGIAAANAANDIFAMGGRVLFGLNLAAMPERLGRDVVKAIFAGGMAKLGEAGGVVAGGHTIRDAEPKYGMAVIGLADPAHLLRKNAAQPGDVLVLTKALGTGLIIGGKRRGILGSGAFDAAVASMLELNRTSAQALLACGVHAATDVTGFGLLGHALEMARASDCRLTVRSEALPTLDGAVTCAGNGVSNSGARHNRRFVAPFLYLAPRVDPVAEAVAYDPQTSGGMLASIPAARLDAVKAAFADRHLDLWEVGAVARGSGVSLV